MIIDGDKQVKGSAMEQKGEALPEAGRKAGVVLAMGAAAATVVVALMPVPQGFVAAGDPRLMLALAAVYLVLGLLLHQGKGWAVLVLMGVITAHLLIPNLIALQTPGIHFGRHEVFWLCRLSGCVLAWVLWVFVFYRACRKAPAATGG